MLKAERAAMVAAARAHRVRYLRVLQQIGVWNKENGLVRLTPEQVAKAVITEVKIEEVRVGEAAEPLLLRPFLGMDTAWLEQAVAELGE